MVKRPLKVLIGKPGLDGHDRGAKVVARALMDAGMEVIYSGLHCSVENLVDMAIDEDVDVLGLSVLNGAHNSYAGKVVSLLRERGAGDIKIVVGGNIPPTDYEVLKGIGVQGVFGNSSLGEVVAFYEQIASGRSE